MKLRTEVSGFPGDMMVIYDADCGLSIDAEAEHDIMAAHALLQAMDEEIERVSTVEYNSREICAHFMAKVKQRAARILASWGVEQEVAG